MELVSITNILLVLILVLIVVILAKKI